MSPDDPKHGTVAGYKMGCRQQCCRDAAAHYQRWREYDTNLGRPRTLPSTGFRRRIEALRAIGWSLNDIADAINMDVRNLPRTCKAETVYRATHQKLAEAYEHMCMKPPTDRFAARRRTLAVSRGCVPPLAWDDIDTDPEPPTADQPVRVDHAAIQRVLDGDTTIKPTPTELKHIVRTLHKRGLTDAQIAARTNTKHNTIQATRQRLGLPLNPANLNWAEFGIKPRVRPHRNKKAA